METKHIKISEYDYVLPDERIAKFPLPQRDHSKLLIYERGKVSDDVFFNLPKYLPQHALMVYNNTRVINVSNERAMFLAMYDRKSQEVEGRFFEAGL